jgi:hypothetical protein
VAACKSDRKTAACAAFQDCYAHALRCTKDELRDPIGTLDAFGADKDCQAKAEAARVAGCNLDFF